MKLYETFYWSGGHGGPHESLAVAVDHAVRYQTGHARTARPKHAATNAANLSACIHPACSNPSFGRIFAL